MFIGANDGVIRVQLVMLLAYGGAKMSYMCLWLGGVLFQAIL